MLQSEVLVVRLASFDGSPKAMALLAHELLHAVVYVMGAIGIKLSEDSEEAFTYALQDITAQALEVLK
jgi:hypothetical protein